VSTDTAGKVDAARLARDAYLHVRLGVVKSFGPTVFHTHRPVHPDPGPPLQRPESRPRERLAFIQRYNRNDCSQP
jgi:hypothetical protein